MIFRDEFVEKKKQPILQEAILWKFSGQISLERDWFCTELASVNNKIGNFAFFFSENGEC